MKVPQDIINSQPTIIRDMFIYWSDYMYKNIFFEKPESDIHAYDHCERVLFYALILGLKISGNSESALTALAHASVFHDTSRQNDYLDVGHGGRAAEYYKNFCDQSGLSFSETAWLIMKYHDRDDAEGISAIDAGFKKSNTEAVTLYRIFKDADALDRFRLSPWGPDKSFLRFRESILLIDFAGNLVKKTTDPEILKRTMELTSIFADKLSKGK